MEIIPFLHMALMILLALPGAVVAKLIDAFTNGRSSLGDNEQFVVIAGAIAWVSLLYWLSQHVTITWT